MTLLVANVKCMYSESDTYRNKILNYMHMSHIISLTYILCFII